MGLLPEGTELSPRPPWVPAWDDLAPEDQAVAARFMECFAGFLSHADAQIGRVLAFLDELGERDNTIVVLVSDNGASAEGGERGSINDARLWNGNPAGRRELRERIDEIGTPTAHNNYPWGWTMAGNTPFRRWKREVHEGGVADPCIVHWPRGIAGAGRDPPPVRARDRRAADDARPDRRSTRPEELARRRAEPDRGHAASPRTLRAADAPEHHTTQYFEMLGSRGHLPRRLEGGDVQAARRRCTTTASTPTRRSRTTSGSCTTSPRTSRSATTSPARSPSGSPSWSTSGGTRRAATRCCRSTTGRSRRCSHPRRPFDDRDRYVFWPHGAPIPENVTVNVRNRNHTITADVEVPEGVVRRGGAARDGDGARRLVAARASTGRLRYVHNFVGKERYTVTSDVVVPPGRARAAASRSTSRGDFSGVGRLLVDGAVVGEGEIATTTPVRYSISGAGLTCGWEQGPPVGEGYAAPFRFTGTLHRVVVEVDGEGHRDPEAEFEAIMAEQ